MPPRDVLLATPTAQPQAMTDWRMIPGDTPDDFDRAADIGPGHPLGRWRVVRELGRGGNGVVFEGQDEDGERVAIKLRLDPEVPLDAEARAMKLLDHPRIPWVLDYCDDWIAMQLVPGGRSLRSILAETGDRLPWPEVVRILADVSDALQHALGRGVVHPAPHTANVVVDTDGRGWLVDWSPNDDPADTHERLFALVGELTGRAR